MLLETLFSGVIHMLQLYWGMQIVSLSQGVSRRQMGEKGVKGVALLVTYSITSDYEPCS